MESKRFLSNSFRELQCPLPLRKCLKEEIHKDVLVTGEFEVNEIAGQKVDLMVTDTTGHHLVSRENVDKAGKFAFTTDKYDMFSLCFHSVVPTNMRGQRHEVSCTTDHRFLT